MLGTKQMHSSLLLLLLVDLYALAPPRPKFWDSMSALFSISSQAEILLHIIYAIRLNSSSFLRSHLERLQSCFGRFCLQDRSTAEVFSEKLSRLWQVISRDQTLEQRLDKLGLLYIAFALKGYIRVLLLDFLNKLSIRLVTQIITWVWAFKWQSSIVSLKLDELKFSVCEQKSQ